MAVLLKRLRNIRMVPADLRLLWSQSFTFIGWVIERFRRKKGKHGHAKGTNEAIAAVEEGPSGGL